MKKNERRAEAYHTIDRMYYIRDALKKAVAELKSEGSHQMQKIGGGGRSFISDPTANTALRNVEGPSAVEVDGVMIKHPSTWIRIMDHVYSSCNDLEKNIIDLKYRNKANYLRICMLLCIEQNAYYYMLRDIKSYTVELACQNGLVKPYKL